VTRVLLSKAKISCLGRQDTNCKFVQVGESGAAVSLPYGQAVEPLILQSAIWKSRHPIKKPDC